MVNKYIVLDVETQKAFEDVEGRKTRELGISVVGLYQSHLNQYTAIEEKDIKQLNSILGEFHLVIGFNIKSFDYEVLQPYLNIPLAKLPTLDILEDIKNTLGHRVSLNSVAGATLGMKKTGDGLEAIHLYRTGQIEKLKSYCLNDVKLTKEVYEFGLQHQLLKYFARDGVTIKELKVNWKPIAPAELSLF